MSEAANHVVAVGGLLPPDMAHACEAAGVGKASRDWVTLFVLGVLAGAFIALGAMFMTVVLTGSGDLPLGVARLLAGLVFSLGLILVVVGVLNCSLATC
jgi:formate/nitrite transporter FocA (FNT family)